MDHQNETEQTNEMMSKMGIEIDEGKIAIDINKTKGFFSALQEMLQNKAEDLQKNIAEGKLDMADSAGIKIDKEHIDIDLTKTRSFIEELGKKVEGMVGQIDHTVEKIGIKAPDRGEG